MFVGGEFYTDQQWLSDRPTFSSEGMLFLSGGKACLMLIGDYLRDHGIEKILLPSYLCPSILTALEHSGIGFGFYQVNEDFSIDLEDLARKSEAHRAVYFINYFGFLHSEETRGFFRQLRQNGLIVVEDNAQAGFHNHPTGDFIFNSLRKFVPYDGGYLISDQDMTPYLQKYHDRPNRRLPVIRAYRQRLYQYLLEDEDDHAELEALFYRAEQYYEEDLAVLGDPHERDQIERLDWRAIKRVRRENYAAMLGLIADIDAIKPIFPALGVDNMPLGLPVYFSGVSRDQVIEELGSAGVSLSIHWEEILDDPRTHGNRLAVDMSSRILTLVIDQRTSRKQLEYQTLKLVRGIAMAKS